MAQSSVAALAPLTAAQLLAAVDDTNDAPWLRLRTMAGERLLSAMEVVEQADREAAARRHADTRTTQEAVARREAEAEVARLRA